MKKRQNFFMVTGVPSLFLIFAVLCMVILGLLALGTSRTDLEMSRASLKLESLYNEACRKAADLCLEAERALIEAAKEAADEEDYFRCAKKISRDIPGASWDEELHQITAEVKITEEQSLKTVLQVLYPGGVRMVSWKTVVSEVWEPQIQPVYRGE